MTNNIDSVTVNLALQEEMKLQYEALLEEMNKAPREKRFEHVANLSAHLRRLSEFTRSTASELKYKY